MSQNNKLSKAAQSNGNNNDSVDLSESFKILYDDVNSLWCADSSNISKSNGNTNITVLDDIPSSIEFLRGYVTPSIPCIIKNSIFFIYITIFIIGFIH